jgi:hypothetical protein
VEPPEATPHAKQLELGFSGECIPFPAPPKTKRRRQQCAGFRCPSLAEMSQTLRYALELLDDDELDLLTARLSWLRRSRSAANTWSTGSP